MNRHKTIYARGEGARWRTQRDGAELRPQPRRVHEEPSPREPTEVASADDTEADSVQRKGIALLRSHSNRRGCCRVPVRGTSKTCSWQGWRLTVNAIMNEIFESLKFRI